jgi:hypothetical protein
MPIDDAEKRKLSEKLSEPPFAEGNTQQDAEGSLNGSSAQQAIGLRPITVTAPRDENNSIASQFYGPLGVNAIAATKHVDPDQVNVFRVATSPSQTKGELDQINVYAQIDSGFNWSNLLPFWSLGMCMYFGCDAWHWGLGAAGAIPPLSVEGLGVKVAGNFAAARGAAGTLKGLGNIGSHGIVDAGSALRSAEKWLGTGYKEIAPGVFRSSDGLRQFRMTTSDLLPTHGSIGSHVHFEALDASGKVIENLHLPVTP